MTTNRLSIEPTFVELVAGVASGVRELATAHSAQVRAEVGVQAGRARTAAQQLAVGGGLATIGGALIAIALVQLLQEFAGWPAWAAWLTVGGAVSTIGWTVLAVGTAAMQAIRPWPEQSIRAIQESLTWTP